SELVGQYNCGEEEQDQHISIPVDDREYIAELGYLKANNDWLSLARSLPVRVPACPPEVPQSNIAATAARVITGAAAATTTFFSPRSQAPETSQIILVPRDCRSAYAYWEVPTADRAALGGQQLLLRLYEVITLDGEGLTVQTVGEYDCAAREQDKHVSIPIDDRDYVAELGYLTANNDWLSLARSLPVRVPPCPPNK
ncbi:MAG: DUF4912 domain-containing protein, partial [Gomphosphaeria aponina SAG 52.96 = DSM 107014]|nr:DUF4912 domain-containing protein [Gomphosphaeria aponina SAG 52.96 = DSM 107014]